MTATHLTLHATVGDDGRYVVRDDTGKVVFTCQPGQSYIVSAEPVLVIPGVSRARGVEEAERYGAASRVARVARDLREGSARLLGIASELVSGERHPRAEFPATALVRDASMVMRRLAATVDLDAALDDAVRADREMDRRRTLDGAAERLVTLRDRDGVAEARQPGAPSSWRRGVEDAAREIRPAQED